MKMKRTENERSRPYVRIRTATKKHMFEIKPTGVIVTYKYLEFGDSTQNMNPV
jgi:hypothetical protein